MDRLLRFITGKSQLPLALDKIIRQYGNIKVKNVLVCRVPVQNVIQGILNTFSGGELKSKLEKSNYDNLYHLSMYLILENGTKIKLEKNERIHTQLNPPDEKEDCDIVSQVVNIPFNQFIANTIKRMGMNSFVRYDPRTNNCQDFILNLLRANKISNSTLEKFIKQDADDILFDANPNLYKVSKVITDVAGGVSEAIEVAKEVKKTPIGQVVSKLVEPFAPFFSAVNKSFSGVFEPTKKTPEHRAVSTPPEPEVETVERVDEPMVD